MFGPVEFIHRTPPKYKGQIFPHLISFLPNLPHTFGERIVGQHHATRPVSWQSLAGGLIPSSVPLTIPKSHLYVLPVIEKVEDLNLLTLGTHPLKGSRKGEWGMTVTKNWRIYLGDSPP